MNGAHKSPGTLYIVGIGPGSPGLLTPDAAAAIGAADTVVGYHGYLDLIASRLEGKGVVGRDLGHEVERARVALDQAEQGHTVALVSSGDAGIYGMGGVVWELAAERAGRPEIVMVPGVTAACSAAARLGAPLAHDWACVSLSDLLTPWPIIVQRVDAAARADFVLVLYNPASQSRTWQLAQVAERLLRYRHPDTPVGLVENAYRTNERVERITLRDLGKTRVSMFTTVIVGSSQSFERGGAMITPRIYAAKTAGEEPRAPIETTPGEAIMAESLALIERELGPTPEAPGERAVLRRMIHASADFDYAVNVRFGPGAIAAAIEALRRDVPILVDVEMLRAGIRRDLCARVGVEVVCAIDERETAALAARDRVTRSSAGIRRLAGRYGDGAVMAIGNAPTALDEAVRLIELDGWRPACIVGIPVGFVGVAESKRRLVSQTAVPYVTSLGRKGGTPVTAAAVNALLELVGAPR